MNCPWNGRVWPMTNAHIAEGLAQSALRFNHDELRMKTAEFITKFIRMMCFDGDPARPNCFEHYNPITGRPSVFRGVDDYMHSAVVDLIIKYVAGVRPMDGLIVIDPFPFDVRSFTLDDAIVQGRRLKVERKGDEFGVWVDGVRAGMSHLGTPIVIRRS